MPTPDKETLQLITAARILGAGTLAMVLSDDELSRLCAVAAYDLGKPALVAGIATADELAGGYYGTPLDWFQQPSASPVSLYALFTSLSAAIPDFATYFKSLCALHKRRRKFKMILEFQPVPKLEQIVPRCLLEFGMRPSETLASWLVWRKWLYDVDNRAAQETGYLFEPILAAAMGGVPFAAAHSPIKRADNPTKGRQVDCIVGDKEAYEFKMRVTIAASGQGRFQEELDFARDCHASGFTPILLVLDPTPSTRLADLSSAYARFGGRAYTGEDGWNHILEKAGPVMGQFIEKYVRRAVQEVDRAYGGLQPIQLQDAGQ